MKDAIIALFSLADVDEMCERLERIEDMALEYMPMLYENNAWMWLWRRCGGIFYGAKTVCTSGTYHTSGTGIGLGRQRSSLPGKRKTTLGAEEVEREER